MMYGREALRRLREQQEQAVGAAKHPDGNAHVCIDDVPADAPMEDAALTVWNGERFVEYDRWLATAPIAHDEKRPEDNCTIPADADCVVGECGGTQIWLVRDGQRWLMYVGSRKAGGRRHDFASPCLGHAIRTAEQWYGAAGGWRAEKGRDGRAAGTDKGADLPPQDSTVEEGTGKRGHDDLDLGGL